MALVGIFSNPAGTDDFRLESAWQTSWAFGKTLGITVGYNILDWNSIETLPLNLYWTRWDNFCVAMRPLPLILNLAPIDLAGKRTIPYVAPTGVQYPWYSRILGLRY